MKNLTEMSNEELWELFPIVLCGHKEEWKQMYENEKKLLLHSIGGTRWRGSVTSAARL